MKREGGGEDVDEAFGEETIVEGSGHTGAEEPPVPGGRRIIREEAEEGVEVVAR